MIELFREYLQENIYHPTGGMWEKLAYKLIFETEDVGLKNQMLHALEQSNGIRKQVHSQRVPT